MRRLGRIVLIGLGVALVATVIAGAWFALTFDPNAYRDKIATLVHEATGRELTIEGDLSVTLLPRLGIGVGAARLAQAPGFGPTPFATLTEMEADLRLGPLVLHRRIEIGRLRVHGVAVELMRQPDGRTNWADLGDLALRRDDAAAGGVPSSIRLSETEIDGVRVHYVDQRGSPCPSPSPSTDDSASSTEVVPCRSMPAAARASTVRRASS
jgi:AsmA protein